MEENNLEASGERKLNCSEMGKCFQLLESILDGEAMADGQAALDEKLAKCQPCFERYHLEQAIKEVLKTKCTKKEVPTELVSNIRQKIADFK